jgi:hypothetical protein
MREVVVHANDSSSIGVKGLEKGVQANTKY